MKFIYAMQIVISFIFPSFMSLPELYTNSEQHDKMYVMVPCRVAAIKTFNGRLGSMYAQITCAESLAVLGYISDTGKRWSKVNPGEKITIRGRYYKSAWINGVIKHNFIDIKTIYRGY